jgi:hypothetical protein
VDHATAAAVGSCSHQGHQKGGHNWGVGTLFERILPETARRLAEQVRGTVGSTRPPLTPGFLVSPMVGSATIIGRYAASGITATKIAAVTRPTP